jgi:transcriptional regulator with XRE-family HTH domain
MPIVQPMILHEILTEKGISGPSELGRQLEISKQHAWLLWHGTVLPGPELLRKLRDRLDISVEQLLELERAQPLKPRGPRPRRYDPGRGGHAPGHLRDAFLAWVQDCFHQPDEVPLPQTVVVGETERPVSWLLGQLWNCTDILPSGEFDQINDWLIAEGLPRIDRQTYAAAVRALKLFVSSEDEGSRGIEE